MYRVSATVLEKFRRVLAAAHDDSNTWDTEESLLETLTGRFEGNDKTRIGSAFHALIEHGRPEKILPYTSPGASNKSAASEIHYHISQGFAFTPEQAEIAYAYKRSHPLMFCEVPAGKFYHVPGTSFYISGRVDGLEGKQVRDAKTKFSSPTAQEYLDSCQWKFYLDILGVKEFYFDLFEVKSFPRDGIGAAEMVESDQGVEDGRPEYIWFLDQLRIVPHEPISCFAYPTMDRYLFELTCAFAEWIRNRNYWHLLAKCNPDGSYTTPPAGKAAAAPPRAQTAEANTTGATA